MGNGIFKWCINLYLYIWYMYGTTIDFFFSFDREEQKQCRNRMSQLETERDQVFKEIQGAESDKNT